MEVFLENMARELVGLANEIHVESNYEAQLIASGTISVKCAPANLPGSGSHREPMDERHCLEQKDKTQLTLGQVNWGEALRVLTTYPHRTV